MKLENILILISITIIFTFACTSTDTYNTTDSCALFKEKNSWYKATKKSYDKWGIPISFQLAVVNQESSFNQFAKPKRKRFLGLIPGSRASTAFGYAQVINPTWDWYKNRTGNKNASRANFSDIADFIGWYGAESSKMLGISKNDYYNQYLAYHEGQGGWKNSSFNSKKWLLDVALKVERQSNIYKNQLKDCESKLNNKRILGIF